MSTELKLDEKTTTSELLTATEGHRANNAAHLASIPSAKSAEAMLVLSYAFDLQKEVEEANFGQAEEEAIGNFQGVLESKQAAIAKEKGRTGAEKPSADERHRQREALWGNFHQSAPFVFDQLVRAFANDPLLPRAFTYSHTDFQERGIQPFLVVVRPHLEARAKVIEELRETLETEQGEQETLIKFLEGRIAQPVGQAGTSPNTTRTSQLQAEQDQLKKARDALKAQAAPLEKMLQGLDETQRALERYVNDLATLGKLYEYGVLEPRAEAAAKAAAERAAKELAEQAARLEVIPPAEPDDGLIKATRDFFRDEGITDIDMLTDDDIKQIDRQIPSEVNLQEISYEQKMAILKKAVLDRIAQKQANGSEDNAEEEVEEDSEADSDEDSNEEKHAAAPAATAHPTPQVAPAPSKRTKVDIFLIAVASIASLMLAIAKTIPLAADVATLPAMLSTIISLATPISIGLVVAFSLLMLVKKLRQEGLTPRNKVAIALNLLITVGAALSFTVAPAMVFVIIGAAVMNIIMTTTAPAQTAAVAPMPAYAVEKGTTSANMLTSFGNSSIHANNASFNEEGNDNVVAPPARSSSPPIDIPSSTQTHNSSSVSRSGSIDSTASSVHSSGTATPSGSPGSDSHVVKTQNWIPSPSISAVSTDNHSPRQPQ